MSRLAVGIPISRTFDWRTCVSQFHAIVESRGDTTFITRGWHDRPWPIERARNSIAQEVIDNGHEWLFFLDSDATLPRGALARLLSWDQPIVSAMAFKRKRPVTPACGLRGDATGPHNYPPPVDAVADWLGYYPALIRDYAVMLTEAPPDALMRVDVVGTHCLLIHRSVLETVPAPWFERTTGEDEPATGSDWDFCEKARDAGYDIYVDRSIVSGHLTGPWELAGVDFMAWTIWSRYARQVFTETEED